MNKLHFYDPLYDFVTFEQAAMESPRDFFRVPGFDGGFGGGGIQSPNVDLREFVSSAEFNRLAFLKQSDLAFLTFPSSNHTRFAHGIGCCYLGYMAARDIRVGMINVRAKSSTESQNWVVHLAEWLQGRGWKEEFLLALLLHDIGHFAFSHTLERNPELWLGLQEKIHHEEVARQFILGTGPMFDAFGSVMDIPEGCLRVHQLVERGHSHIDPHVVCYLIAGEEKDLPANQHDRQQDLKMLHELTSGLLDLDRVDHYRRDSYFSGMKFASNLNFASLLNGLSIWYDPSGTTADKPVQAHVRLSRDAIGHALTLLHAKERLVQDCFEHEDNIAYQVMLRQAFNLFVFGDDFYLTGGQFSISLNSARKLAYELLVMTDEELLCRLTLQGSDKIKRIIRCIRNRIPYHCVGKRSWPKGTGAPHIWDLRRRIVDLSGVSADDILIVLGSSYGRKRDHRPTEWLKLDSLLDEHGHALDGHPSYKMQIEHFKRVQDAADDHFWLLTGNADPGVIGRIRDALDSVVTART